MKTTDTVSLIISAENQGIMDTHWASHTALGLSVALSYAILATCELYPSCAALQQTPFWKLHSIPHLPESISLSVMLRTVPAFHTHPARVKDACLDVYMTGGVGERSGHAPWRQ